MKSKQSTTFTTSDYSLILQRIVSLKDVNVLAYHRDAAHQYLEIEQNIPRPCCPACNVPAKQTGTTSPTSFPKPTTLQET